MPPIPPPYPLDERTHAITLPAAVSHEIYHLAAEVGVTEAARRVMELTGANHKMAQAYVEALLQAR